MERVKKYPLYMDLTTDIKKYQFIISPNEKDVIKKYNLLDKQYAINDDSFYVKLPHKEILLKSFIKDMKHKGYFLDYYMFFYYYYYEMRFVPYEKYNITSEVREHEYLYFYSQTHNLDEISILPSDNPLKKNYFTYEERTNIVLNLFRPRKEDNYYTLYQIDIKSLPDNINFYWDSIQNFAVFTEDIIPSKSIKKLKYGYTAGKEPFEILKLF